MTRREACKRASIDENDVKCATCRFCYIGSQCRRKAPKTDKEWNEIEVLVRNTGWCGDWEKADLDTDDSAAGWKHKED